MSRKKPGAKKLYNYGLSRSRVYKIFMKLTCAGNAGKIIISKEWVGRGAGFNNFVANMGHPPDGHSLYFKDSETIYGPGKCEWRADEPKSKPLPLNFIILSDVEINSGGVYKLMFSNGTFYIGSTRNFKSRISVFKTEIKEGYSHNKRMRQAILESEFIEFVVIEYIVGIDALKPREDFYLKQLANDPMMLNRSISAFSNEGIKWTEDEVNSMKIALYRLETRGRPFADCPLPREQIASHKVA